jgi:hypothetical protein
MPGRYVTGRSKCIRQPQQSPWRQREKQWPSIFSPRKGARNGNSDSWLSNGRGYRRSTSRGTRRNAFALLKAAHLQSGRSCWRLHCHRRGLCRDHDRLRILAFQSGLHLRVSCGERPQGWSTLRRDRIGRPELLRTRPASFPWQRMGYCTPAQHSQQGTEVSGYEYATLKPRGLANRISVRVPSEYGGSAQVRSHAPDHRPCANPG